MLVNLLGLDGKPISRPSTEAERLELARWEMLTEAERQSEAAAMRAVFGRGKPRAA